MEGVATAQLDESLTVVGETDGALVRALRRRGARASAARLHELGRAASTLVLLGNAAVDGGRGALASAPKGTRAIVVLPRGAAAARIAACAIGAHVVESTDLEPLADAVVSSLNAQPSRELGWTDLGSLLDAFGDSVAQKLGRGGANSRGLRLQVGDAEELTQLLDRFADALVPLCQKTERPGPDGPGIAVAELTWDDDPQTLQQEDAEVARWRRLSVRGARAKMIRGLRKDREVSGEWGNPVEDPPQRDHLVDSSAELASPRPAADRLRSAASSSFGLPGTDGGSSGPVDLPSGVFPEMSSDSPNGRPDPDEEDLDTATNAAPLPLLYRQDPDISETAPREVIRPEMVPDLVLPELSSVALTQEDSQEMTAPLSRSGVASLPPAVAGPAAELSSSSVSAPVVLPMAGAGVPAVEAPARRSKLPLVVGLGLVALSGIAVAAAVGLSWRSAASQRDGAAEVAAAGGAASEVAASEVAASEVAASGSPVPETEAAPAATPTSRGAVAPAPTARPPHQIAEQTPEQPSPVVEPPASGEAAPATEEAAPTLGPPEDFAAARARSDEFVAVGREAARAQDWDAARRSFETALEIHEPNPHAHAELARERMRAGDGTAAVRHAARAVALRRRRARYHVLLGDARRVAGQQQAARRAYEQALRVDPDNAAASRALGRR